MFFHNLKYTLKTLFRNKMLIFWTYAFPIILGTLFMFAFSNIEKNEQLKIIDIAIVDNQEFKDNKIIKEAFSNLGDSKNENQLFNIKYTNKEEAQKMLDKDDITGYLLIENEKPKIVLKTNGINETVFTYALQEITQTGKMVEDIAKNEIQKEIINGNINIDYEKIYTNALNLINNQENNIIKDVSKANLSYTMIEFYTLIAMACLYGSLIGMFAINNTLANMSFKGMRVAVSPINKFKLIISSVTASFIAQLIGIALLLLYTIFVLNVNYGSNILYIILLAVVGSIAGLSVGIVVGALFRKGEATKTGIVLAFTMFGCFLSGMMGITMKYIVDKNMPIINKLNPANMITDGFYSLYYYTTLDRFWFNVISLAIFACLMIVISIIILRRQKYDSI